MDNERKKRYDARKEKNKDYTRNILIHGLWQTESQIDNIPN